MLAGASLLAALGSCGPDASDQSAETRSSVTIAVPPARPPQDIAAVSEPLPEPSAAGLQPEPRTSPRVAEPPAEPAAPPATAPDDSQELANDVTEAPPSVDPEPTTVAAKPPLPNSVMARTIERIGYSCGRVTAVTSVEGPTPGVFRVTCTSGASFRAAPVNGRYRFRRFSDRGQSGGE